MVHITLHEKPPNATHRSLPSMAAAADISYSSASRLYLVTGGVRGEACAKAGLEKIKARLK